MARSDNETSVAQSAPSASFFDDSAAPGVTLTSCQLATNCNLFKFTSYRKDTVRRLMGLRFGRAWSTLAFSSCKRWCQNGATRATGSDAWDSFPNRLMLIHRPSLRLLYPSRLSALAHRGATVILHPTKRHQPRRTIGEHPKPSVHHKFQCSRELPRSRCVFFRAAGAARSGTHLESTCTGSVIYRNC